MWLPEGGGFCFGGRRVSGMEEVEMPTEEK